MSVFVISLVATPPGGAFFNCLRAKDAMNKERPYVASRGGLWGTFGSASRGWASTLLWILIIWFKRIFPKRGRLPPNYPLGVLTEDSKRCGVSGAGVPCLLCCRLTAEYTINQSLFVLTLVWPSRGYGQQKFASWR